MEGGGREGRKEGGGREGGRREGGREGRKTWRVGYSPGTTLHWEGLASSK